MNNLPETWAQFPLRDVCTKITDGTHHSPPNLNQGEFKYITAKNIKKSGLDLKKITFVSQAVHEEIFSRCSPEKGDVLYIKDGATTGTAINNPLSEPFSMLSSVALLKPDRAILNERFLCCWLNSPETFASMTGLMGGSAIRRLTLKKISSSCMPVPPLAEQERIVEKLDRLSERSSAAREHLTRVTTLATRAKQAILMRCLSGDWPSVPLSDIAKVGTGATPKKGTSRFYDGGTIPWITSGAVNDFRIVSTEQFITPAAISETNCKVYPVGTLLMAMYGEGKTRGMVARLEIEAATNQALAAIQINSNAPVRDDWVIWLLHSRYLQLRELASGGVQPNLNLGMVKAILVPIPSLADQDARLKKMKAAFARIDRLTEEAASAGHLLDRLDERLLAKAFQGDLVPQDPNDEPAEALLKRIRETRAAVPKPKRARRKTTA